MPKPNIVLIVADDHGYADRSILGIHPDVRTPNLDRLAREGVSFEEAYVTAPICSPSRCGLLTGRYQERWGALWFGNSRLQDGVPTIAEKLKEQGYKTGFVGKVHYGIESDKPDARGFPPNQGYDESYFAMTGGRTHYLHHSADAVRRYGRASQQMSVQPLWHNRSQVDFEGFTTWEFGERARSFVESAGAQPFFLHLAFNAVHNFAWQLPPEELAKRGLPPHDDWLPDAGEYLDWYDNAIMPNLERGRDYYLAQLELMDQEIGRLLDHLDRTGQAENTIVVYTSDNGGSTCNYGDNTPLQGTKYTLYEGGIRVPMVVRWPQGKVPAGEKRRGMVSTLDLMPTFLAAAGAPAKSASPTDGNNLLGLLRNGQGKTHRSLYWDNGFQYAVRRGDWKLYRVPSQRGVAGLRKLEHADMGKGTELFNLKDDLGERRNLAEERPDVVRRLEADFAAWRKQMQADARRYAAERRPSKSPG